jgi:SNF2 family DNA or RNA helicase
MLANLNRACGRPERARRDLDDHAFFVADAAPESRGGFTDEAEGLAYTYLDGSTPAARRAAIVEDFQKGSLPLFLISLKAGGSGLNLTAADNVIHLDPWWNPAVEDQASDRAHRIGQTKPVTIYRLVSRGTIEDGILALHRDKRALVEAALSGSGQAAGLSSDELVALIRDAVPRRPSR